MTYPKLRFNRQQGVVLMRGLVPLCVSILCIWLLTGVLEITTWQALPQKMALVPPLHLVGGIALCALSLWSVGRYDVVAHRHLQTKISTRQAQRGGMIAICLSQTIGLGVVTGALSRWRMLAGLNVRDALQLSAFVSVTFLCSLCFVTALICLALPAPAWTFWPAFGIVALSFPFLFVLFWTPGLSFRRLNIRWPSITAVAAILIWTGVDTFAAAGALYLLIPSDMVNFSAFLPIFLLALGAALLSGAPGGVGPFELALLGGLPMVPQPELLAGVVAFRVFYYAIPAVIAVFALARPFVTPPPVAPLAPASPTAHRADVGVVEQNSGYLLKEGNTSLALWPTRQALISFATPLNAHLPDSLQVLTKAATWQNRIPLFYKCSARHAAEAKRNGWAVLRIAQEASLNPRTFDISGPKRRSLRRKLKAAKSAEVTPQLQSRPNFRSLAQIDADWQRRNGPARGGSMGRYCPAYLSKQQVFVAYLRGTAVAFVSFQTNNGEWSLDLIRTRQDAPDGTVHALIIHAVKHAAAAGITEFSLAAVPDNAPTRLSRIARSCGLRYEASGLRQFKNSFAPQWHPVYAAAPKPLLLVLALVDVARAVHFPDPLPATKEPHDDNEVYEVAYICAP